MGEENQWYEDKDWLKVSDSIKKEEREGWS